MLPGVARFLDVTSPSPASAHLSGHLAGQRGPIRAPWKSHFRHRGGRNRQTVRSAGRATARTRVSRSFGARVHGRRGQPDRLIASRIGADQQAATNRRGGFNRINWNVAGSSANDCRGPDLTSAPGWPTQSRYINGGAALDVFGSVVAFRQFSPDTGNPEHPARATRCSAAARSPMPA